MQSRETKPKTAITQVLKESSIPLTLENIFQHVKAELPETAFSTVYRTVQNLKSEGRILSLDWRDRGGRFEWAKRTHHHHLSCKSCGEIADIDDTILNFQQVKVERETGFSIEHHSIELSGICRGCQKND